MSDNKFEDVVRAAMRAHDHEAPTAADLRTHRPVRAKPSRARWIAPLAAAACVLALVGTLFAINRSGGEKGPIGAPATTTTAKPLDCPDTYHQAKPGEPISYWVPSPPSGFDGSSRLVPDEVPAHAVVCAYLHEDKERLTGSTPIVDGTDNLRSDLAWLPGVIPGQEDDRVCTTIALQTDGDNYLLGLTYEDSTVWVSAPGNHCDGSSNGRFTTFANLRASAEAAYTSGAWTVPSTDSDACSPSFPGRLGQTEAMVPVGFRSVQVCLRHGSNLPNAETGPLITGRSASTLAQAFNALPTEPWRWRCQPSEGPNHDVYKAIFRYPSGPPVVVEVTSGCAPGVVNFSLQSANADSVLPLIKDLLPQK